MSEPGVDRRTVLRAGALAVPLAGTLPGAAEAAPPQAATTATSRIEVNGQARTVSHDVRRTLLDLLREDLGLTGTKKGCDHGQCGACTIHVDGRRVLACLSLAAAHDGAKVTTIEGLAKGDELHPMQAAFIAHDALQCGYCTPGQIMSAVALVAEGRADSADSVRQYMSGNLCRCAAYPQIVAAVLDGARAMRG